MEHQKFEFPSVIKLAVNGLDNKWRWKILECIMNKGDMSYSKLMTELELDNKGLLNFHLKNLSKSALIERYEDLNNTSGDRSFYSISSIGKEIINGILSGLNPDRKILYFHPGILADAAISSEKNHYSVFFDESKTMKISRVEQPAQNTNQALEISASATG